MGAFTGRRAYLGHYSKRKLPGKEISVPANPTPVAIKANIKSMLASGTLSLGEPYAPYSLSHVKVVDGQVVKTTSVVHGRRIPLAGIRQKLLDKHEKFMHLLSDSTIASLPEPEIRALLEGLHEVTADKPEGELRERVRQLQRSCTISFWHDHSSILGCSYILATVQAVYDLAVFE